MNKIRQAFAKIFPSEVKITGGGLGFWISRILFLSFIVWICMTLISGISSYSWAENFGHFVLVVLGVGISGMVIWLIKYWFKESIKGGRYRG